MNLIPADYQEDARDQTNGGGSSQGFGYTARALIERRVTANWFVGTAVDIQQAKDYTPSHLLLYVRYSAAGWQGIWIYRRSLWCLTLTGNHCVRPTN